MRDFYINIQYGYYQGQLDTITGISQDVYQETYNAYKPFLDVKKAHIEQSNSVADVLALSPFYLALDGAWTYIARVKTPNCDFYVDFRFYLDLTNPEELEKAKAKRDEVVGTVEEIRAQFINAML